MKTLGHILVLTLGVASLSAGASGLNNEYTALGLELHSDQTSFEGLVQKQATQGRGPASVDSGTRYRVIAIRRELGLTQREAERAPIDIVINAGEDAGLAKGEVLKVYRHISIIDPYMDNMQRELEIPFATVRIQHSQPGIAVARVEKVDRIDEGLALGVRGVLIGDYLGE